MTCDATRPQLALYLYDDLAPDERSVVAAHLKVCPTCRAELAELAAVRAALDVTPVPPVRVEAAALHLAEVGRLRRRARRWRLAALVGAALAVGFLLLRLDVRIDSRQLHVRWGPPDPLTPVAIHEEKPVPPPDLDRRIELLDDLVHALAANTKADDRERQDELNQLRAELAELRTLSQQWAATQRDVSALYTAQFGPKPEGVNP